jgi:hypothetical protein
LDDGHPPARARSAENPQEVATDGLRFDRPAGRLPFAEHGRSAVRTTVRLGPTRKGMAVQFQRLRDGESVRTVEGHLVRQPRN